MATTSETLATALEHHRAGRLKNAEIAFRQVLQAEPQRAEAWHLLGVVYRGLQHLDKAIACQRRALELKPNFVEAHYRLGSALSDRGDLEVAVACYRRALELKPDHAGASNSLGVALKAQGKLAEAVAAFRGILTLKPDLAEVHNNLGSALDEQGNLVEAEACYRRAIQVRPKYAAAHHGLGAVLQKQKKLDEAVACYQQALALQPGFFDTLNNLAVALKDQGRLDEAASSYRQALVLRPGDAGAYNNLGNILHDQKRLAEAETCFRQAVALKPGFAEAHNNLGNALRIQGKLDEAEVCCRQAVALKPGYAKAHNNLGIALQAQGKLDEAVTCCQLALVLNPEFAHAHNSLGNTLQAQGKLAEAVACYQQALKFDPGYVQAHSNLLFTLQYQEGMTRSELAKAHAEFEQQHTAPLRTTWKPHVLSRDPDRRLKLGFVSADLGHHPVGYFLIRTLEHLHPQQAEIVCYSDRQVDDEMTARFQAVASTWRKVVCSSDERLAEQIREDEIDILFDLAGHTAGNRLLVFARKPAPIQITWLGYVGTTGLKAIDYLIADHHEIPADAESDYQEKILRMPDDYVCYDPPSDAPPVSPLPALEQGFVTFGCFNNPNKLTAGVIEVWARILQQVPNSRLVLKYRGLNNPTVSGRIADLLAINGIDVWRVEFLGQSPQRQLLAEYGRIDLAFDSFPYSGGLTTCEAMWMGVPVISTPGKTFASRHSLSHLSNVGLTETIARDFDEYVELAVGLAQDLDRLAAMRTRLRQQVAASPLCDGPRFAANLLDRLREAWQHWVELGPV